MAKDSTAKPKGGRLKPQGNDPIWQLNAILSIIYSHVHVHVHVYASVTYGATGFESRERVYRNVPEALLHWKVALEVVSFMLNAHSILYYYTVHVHVQCHTCTCNA